MPRNNFLNAHQAFLEGLPEHLRDYEEAMLQEGQQATQEATRGGREGGSTRGAFRQAGDVARETFRDMRGGRPQGLSRGEQAELRAKEAEEARLQPARQFAPGTLGTPASGNPFSLDTRGAVTGLSNFAISLVNRDRQRRLVGDPDRLGEAAEKRQRAESLLDNLVAGDGTGAGAGRDSIGRAPLSEAATMGAVQDLEQQADEIEREHGGVSTRAGELRQRAQAPQQFDEDLTSFMDEVVPGLGERILRHEQESDLIDQREERDIRADERELDRDVQRHEHTMNEIRERAEQDRLTEDHKNELRDNPGMLHDVNYSQLRDLIESSHPEVPLLENRLEAVNRELSGMDQFERQGHPERVEELEEQREELENRIVESKNEIHQQWREATPGFAPMVSEDELERTTQEAIGDVADTLRGEGFGADIIPRDQVQQSPADTLRGMFNPGEL